MYVAQCRFVVNALPAAQPLLVVILAQQTCALSLVALRPSGRSLFLRVGRR